MIGRVAAAGTAGVGGTGDAADDDMGWSPFRATETASPVALVTPTVVARS
jgi:hypothetical protein